MSSFRASEYPARRLHSSSGTIENKEITANQRNVRRPALSDPCERNEERALLCPIHEGLALSDSPRCNVIGFTSLKPTNIKLIIAYCLSFSKWMKTIQNVILLPRFIRLNFVFMIAFPWPHIQYEN